MKKIPYNRAERGQAIIETAFLVPWIFFLFVGVLDVGFYSYAAICTQNAARVAALANAYSSPASLDTTGACTAVLQEMNALPNTRSLITCKSGTCPSTVGTVDANNPIAVLTCAVPGPDGAPTAQVTVTYFPIAMIPIPGALAGQIIISRTAQVPILNTTPVS